MSDLIHPDDRPDAAERLRADLAGYLRERTGPELAELLNRLPDPVKADLIGELAGRGPAWLRLPPDWPGHPDAEHDRRRWLQEVSPTGGPPVPPAALAPHPAPRSRSGWPPAPTAACRPPTRAGSGGWGRRCAATPPSARSRTSGRRWAGRTRAARPGRSRPRRAGGTGGCARTADPCPRAG